MPVAGVQSANTVGSGQCPHGLPHGACPICSGGMSSASQKKADFSAKPGEMSWNECAAIGAMMRAAKLQKQLNAQAHENRLMQIAKFETTMMNVSQKLAQLAAVIANSTPSAVAKPVNFILNKVAVPVLNALKNAPVNIMRAMDNIRQKIFDIQDKLNAMFGEFKNSVEKKISDTLANFKKKITMLFQVDETTESTDEEKKVEEDKRAFEVKTFINDLYNKITQTTQAYGNHKKEQVEKEKDKGT
ncbi:hypothetical protein IJ843_07720 [bacterium]|nr:hypothetical protein [bacterium]